MNQLQPSSRGLVDRFFSLVESIPGSDRLLVRVAFSAVIITGIWLAFALNSDHSTDTPTYGGTITEGILGTPRFVNPVLALTRADQDVTALVYSGLMKINSDGSLDSDAAESISVSDDGLTYNINLRRDILFHDGVPLTARDVIYTIQLIQDPELKSPLRGNWINVIIEEINDYELNIILEEAYAPFIENFTVGIMPAHLWSSLPIEQLPFSLLNTEPVGSGPFTVTNAGHDASGLIDHYTLKAFADSIVNPKIETVELAFYQNEDLLVEAFKNKEVDATTYIPTELIETLKGNEYQLIEKPLPRTFGIFFNQNRSVLLRDLSARKALTVAVDRSILIEKTLFGHGVPIYGPMTILQPAIESEEGVNEVATGTPAERATTILTDGDWSKNNLGLWEKKIDEEVVTLNVTLRTSNNPLFETLVDEVASQWRAIGVEVTTEQFEQSGLVQSVIRPRDFEALLFGLDMSRSYDLYPFWHSSQQNDPGLNVSQYANVSTDELLETARTEQSEPARHIALQEAGTIISEEYPAVFLFQPSLTYLVHEDITVASMNSLGRPADRFSNVADWHTKSVSLWPLFRNEN